MNRIVRKIASLLPALALIVGVISANSACISYYYQPETPDAMSKYRR